MKKNNKKCSDTNIKEATHQYCMSTFTPHSQTSLFSSFLGQLRKFGLLSPNTLTLIAALCLVIPHIYSWVKYGHSFEG